MTGFDPAAEFLLDLQWTNLFERADARPGATVYRCKGCGELMQQSEQQRHHKQELRARETRRVARQKELQREGARRLALARGR